MSTNPTSRSTTTRRVPSKSITANAKQPVLGIAKRESLLKKETSAKPPAAPRKHTAPLKTGEKKTAKPNNHHPGDEKLAQGNPTGNPTPEVLVSVAPDSKADVPVSAHAADTTELVDPVSPTGKISAPLSVSSNELEAQIAVSTTNETETTGFASTVDKTEVAGADLTVDKTEVSVLPSELDKAEEAVVAANVVPEQGAAFELDSATAVSDAEVAEESKKPKVRTHTVTS